jgi:hypothetical protein
MNGLEDLSSEEAGCAKKPLLKMTRTRSDEEQVFAL